MAKASVIGKAQFDGTVEIAKGAGQKLEKIAIMYEDTAYGTSQATGIRAGAKAAGVEVVMDDAYPLGITDVTPLINKLRASGAQAVFPVSYLNDSLQIIRAMRQQQIKIPAIGGAAGYVIPDFEKGLGEFAEGVLSISPANYDLAPEFTDRFRKRFGYFMVHEALEHAVCLDVLAQAIEKAKSTKSDDLRKVLHGTRFDSGWCKTMTGGVVEFEQDRPQYPLHPGDGAVAQQGAGDGLAVTGGQGEGCLEQLISAPDETERSARWRYCRPCWTG